MHLVSYLYQVVRSSLRLWFGVCVCVCVCVLIMNRCWILSDAFFAPVEMIAGFFFFVNMVYNSVTLVDFHLVIHPCIHYLDKYYLVMVCNPFNMLLDSIH